MRGKVSTMAGGYCMDASEKQTATGGSALI